MASRCFVVLVASALPAAAAALAVGPQGSYRSPCEALALAHNGDVIEIDAAGNYSGDVCAVQPDGLTIRGIHGRAHIDAQGRGAEGKAIWVIKGHDTVIENLEFSGAAGPNKNGAGIRQEGANLTVRYCYFHDNQEGLLANGVPGSHILIEESEFAANGAGDGQSHNLYVGHIELLTVRSSYSHGAHNGHLLKSRAARTILLYNRFSDDGSPSAGYEVDLPNGGKADLIGNVFERERDAENRTFVAYLEEGRSPENPELRIHAARNTFVSYCESRALFFSIDPVADVDGLIEENVFWGRGGQRLTPGVVLRDNLVDEDDIFLDAANHDFRLRGLAAAGIGARGRDRERGLVPQFTHEK
jgi:hypothetical protein